MKKLVNTIALFQVVMTLVVALILVVIFIDIESLQVENLTLKNDLNYAQAKIKIMEETDGKIYKHIETLGGNDLMLQSWIEEINCYLYDCRYEWSEQDEKSY